LKLPFGHRGVGLPASTIYLRKPLYQAALKIRMMIMMFKTPSPTRTNPRTCPPLKAVTKPLWTLVQHVKVTLVLVKTAILIPMYPAIMEVTLPVKKEVAVYGKLDGAVAA